MGRKQRVEVYLAPEKVDQIDDYTNNRSEFLREAAENEIARRSSSEVSADD